MARICKELQISKNKIIDDLDFSKFMYMLVKGKL